MLKFKYDNEADIPAEVKKYYVERDGAWFLNADGAVEKKKLEEFRNNNTAIMQALGVATMEEAKKKLEKLKDVDPELYKTLTEEHKNAEQKKLETKGEYTKALENQKLTLTTEFEKTKKELETKLAAATSRLEKLLIEDAVAMEGAKKGVRPSALFDLKKRALEVFKLKGDKIVAERDGTEIFGKDGEALKFPEWIEGLVPDNPHLFDVTQGTGAHGGGGSGGYTGDNPYSAKTSNLTIQAKLERENPTLAKRLRDSAKIN